MLYKDFIREKSHHLTKVKSAEGYPCKFDKSAGKALKDYKVYGNSIQDGAPTPESPVEIQSVGDLTTKNLLYSNVTTRTINGVTMTYDNGVITLNGTCTTSANFDLNKIVLSAGTYTLSANANKVPVNNGYAFVQLYDSTNNQAITLINSNTMSSITTTISDGTFLYRIRIHEGTTYDNIILQPQLEEGSTATEYGPYHKYDIPIVVRGKNLIKYPYATASRTMNGVKYTVNKDGSVTVVGTATAASYFILYSNVDFGNSSIPANSTNGVYATSEGVRYNVGNHTVSINVASGETVDKIVYPQIEYGTTATVYEPYIEETTHIYLDEPLRKVKDYADYIDFKKGKVVRNVVELNLLSEQVAELYTYNGMVGIRTNAVLREKVRRMSGKCNRVESSNIGDYFQSNAIWLGVGNFYIYWIGILDILGLSTLNEFKEWLDNNPTYIYYGIKSSIEEKIELPKILTQKGSNIITAATAIEPSYIEVKYIKK